MGNVVFIKSSYVSVELAEFLNQTTFLMPNWKWLTLVISCILGLALRYLFKFILRQMRKHNPLAKHFPDNFTAHIFNQPIERPASWILTIFFWMATMGAINIPAKLDLHLTHFLTGLLAINIIILLYHAVDAIRDVSLKISMKNSSAHNFNGQLIPYASKALKVLIVVLGVLIALQSFGLNVMSLLAGLGLGGLALALAAQDTAANVFGSITIMFDNPFKVGDWIKLKDIEGTVEEIGFRSTRIRSFYNSVITIPNAMVAKETVDNLGVRPARRIRHTLGITYETPPIKITQFCDVIKNMLHNTDPVIKDTVTVTFYKYSESSLDILLNFHLRVFASDDEYDLQQKILLNILQISKDLKVDFAYPTRINYQRELKSLE